MVCYIIDVNIYSDSSFWVDFGGFIVNISISLDKAKEIAKSGKYDVIPVGCEILSDFITPIELVRKLKAASKHCYMLESAQANE